MLDPNEMKKGGFGSFVELDRERREERERVSKNGTAAVPGATESETTSPPDASPDAPPTP